MAGGGVTRGPHTGSGTEAALADLDSNQRASLLSSLDFAQLAQLQLPPASGIADYAIFDRDDCRAVHGSLPTFTKSFPAESIRSILDIFIQASAPSVSEEELKASTRRIEIAGKEYTISGPRGGQYPQEIITLHEKKDEGEVLFVAPTATLVLVFKAAPGADVQYMSNEKQGVWTAVRSFAFALTEKGL